MEILIIAGLIALGLPVLGRFLFPARPLPPSVIYVQAEPSPSSGGWGCLPLLLAGIALFFFIGSM